MDIKYKLELLSDSIAGWLGVLMLPLFLPILIIILAGLMWKLWILLLRIT